MKVRLPTYNGVCKVACSEGFGTMCGRGALLGDLDPTGMRPRPNKKTPRNRVLMGAVFVFPDA